MEFSCQVWARSIRLELQQFNDLLQQFRRVADIDPVQNDLQNLHIELRVAPITREVAGILRYGAGARSDARVVVVHYASDESPSRLSVRNPLYEPLSYPILFPQGTPGWPVRGWTQRQYYRFRLLTEARFAQFWKLGNLYTIDMACRMEDERLEYIVRSLGTAQERQRSHQVTELNGDDLGDNEGEQYQSALPSSFIGSRAHRAEHVADALALAKRYGPPQGMITLTTNPEWPEIVEMLTPGQTATSIPQVTARVFRARLHKIIALIKREWTDLAYIVRVTEFQKRGLPHAHIVFAVRIGCSHILSAFRRRADQIFHCHFMVHLIAWPSGP